MLFKLLALSSAILPMLVLGAVPKTKTIKYNCNDIFPVIVQPTGYCCSTVQFGQEGTDILQNCKKSGAIGGTGGTTYFCTFPVKSARPQPACCIEEADGEFLCEEGHVTS